MEGFYIWDIVQNIRETNAENVDLIENRNFIRECAEGAVRGCCGINSGGNNRGWVLL